MTDFGTLSWVERSGGKLTLLNRVAFIAGAARARARTSRRINARLKWRYREVSEISLPDSPAARQAAAMCAAVSEPFLYAHNLRAYYWARLLDDGMEPFDDELLFAAIMLHDLGLTEAHRLHGHEEHCLTIVGARAIRSLALQYGWNEERARTAADAITLHLNITIGQRYGKEARMVRAGTAADVAGLGLDMLHPDQIDEVVRRHPRLGFKKKILSPLALEREERPSSRIGFMQRHLGFVDLIQGTRLFAE